MHHATHPTFIRFDHGEVRRYGLQSLLKLTYLEAESALRIGMAVTHPTRGVGFVEQIDWQSPRGKPFIIHYENGEIHHYGLESVSKLTRGPMRSSRPPSSNAHRAPSPALRRARRQTVTSVAELHDIEKGKSLPEDAHDDTKPLVSPTPKRVRRSGLASDGSMRIELSQLRQLKGAYAHTE